jgi:hypothetical protein
MPALQRMPRHPRTPRTPTAGGLLALSTLIAIGLSILLLALTGAHPSPTATTGDSHSQQSPEQRTAAAEVGQTLGFFDTPEGPRTYTPPANIPGLKVLGAGTRRGSPPSPPHAISATQPRPLGPRPPRV